MFLNFYLLIDMKKIVTESIKRSKSKKYIMSNTKEILKKIRNFERENFWEQLQPYLGSIVVSSLDREDFVKHLPTSPDVAKWLDHEESIGNIDVEKDLTSYLIEEISVRIHEGIKIDDYLKQATILRKYKVSGHEAYKSITQKYKRDLSDKGNSGPMRKFSLKRGKDGSLTQKLFETLEENIYDQKVLGTPLMLEGYEWPTYVNEQGETIKMAFYAQFFDPSRPFQTEFVQLFVPDLKDIDEFVEDTAHIRKIPLIDILTKKAISVDIPDTNIEIFNEMKNNTMCPVTNLGKITKWNLVYTCDFEECEKIPEKYIDTCDDYYFYTQNDNSTFLQVGGINNSCRDEVYENSHYHCLYNYHFQDAGSLSVGDDGTVYHDSC